MGLLSARLSRSVLLVETNVEEDGSELLSASSIEFPMDPSSPSSRSYKTVSFGPSSPTCLISSMLTTPSSLIVE